MFSSNLPFLLTQFIVFRFCQAEYFIFMWLNLSVSFWLLHFWLRVWKTFPTPKLERKSPTVFFSFCMASIFYIKSLIYLDSSKVHIVQYGPKLIFSQMTLVIPTLFIQKNHPYLTELRYHHDPTLKPHTQLCLFLDIWVCSWDSCLFVHQNHTFNF